MKNRPAPQSILTGLFVALVLAVSNSAARAQAPSPCPVGTTSYWNVPSGEFFNPESWSTHCTPNGGTNAFVNNNGVIATFDPNASSQHAHVRVLVLGENQGDSGSVRVDQSAFITLEIDEECRSGDAAPTPSPYLGGDMYIGRRGNGTLAIASGNLVVSGSAFIAAVENQTGSRASGSVTVSGAGTIWRLYGACVGRQICVGCDRLSEGGTTDSGGTGSVTVKDPARLEVYNDDPATFGVKVGRSGTLAGSGTVKLTTQLGPCTDCQTAKVFGTLAPNGQLTIQGKLALDNTAASTILHVTPQGGDNINVTQDTGLGRATLGGRLTVIMAGTFTPARFTLVHADAGLFGSQFQYTSIISLSTGGSCLRKSITYDNYNVYLDIVDTCATEDPEP